MKFLGVSSLLSLCLLLGAFGADQAMKDSDQDYQQFLISTDKPYAYLEVDHVGARRPLRNGEPNTGIWLRLKNNCRLPIVVLAVSGEQNPDKTLVLQDEVVPNRQISGEDARGGGIFAPPGLQRTVENMKDIVRFPNMTEEEVRSAEAVARTSKVPSQRPAGYNIYSGFDRFEVTSVPPGGQVLFSVPANHVGKDWHIEIPFRLAVPNNSQLRPPYSYLAFYKEDLDRAQGKPPAPRTP